MKLAEFAKWVIESGAFDACNLDGGAIQEMAVRCELLCPTRYDPRLHGESDVAEPGDDWYVFSPDFKAALAGTR